MPFNAGGQTYTGGTLLAQGIGNFGQGIGAGILGNIEEHRKKEALTDQIMLQALENGYATPDDWLKYSQSNHKGKQDFAMRIASNFHDDAQKKRELQNAQTQAQIDAQKAQALYHTGQADAQKAAAPYAATGIWTTDADGNPVQVGVYGQNLDPHMFNVGAIKTQKDEPDTGPVKVEVVKDPDSGEVLGRSVRYPGTKQRDFLPKQPETDTRINPQTQLIQRWDGKKWVDLPENLQNQARFNQMRKEQADRAAAPSPTPGPGVLSQAWNALGSIGGGDATPTPTPLDAILQQIPGGGAPQMPQTGNPLDAILQSIAGSGGATAPAPSAGAGKKLDKATAAQFLQQAGGDPNVARQLAAAAGYSF